MHTLSTILAAMALLVACGAFYYAVQALQYLQDNNARSASLAKIAMLDAEFTDLVDSVSVLQTTMRKLSSRDTMRARREKANGVKLDTDEPTDPEEWYKWARKKHLASQSRS